MLYSSEKRKAQVLPGHAAIFVKYVLPGKTEPSTLFVFAHANQVCYIDHNTHVPIFFVASFDRSEHRPITLSQER